MKLSEYAKRQGISYSTALRWWKAGHIAGYQAPSGTIVVTPEATTPIAFSKVAIYARVSTPGQKDNLERQAARLRGYCAVRGYQVTQEVKEIASGVSDSRPKLLALLKDRSITRIVVEHKDRLTRFGFRYIETLLELQGRTIEVVNVVENDQEGLIQDLGNLFYSFCAHMYGQRYARQKTARVVAFLEEKEDTDAVSATGKR